MLQIMKALSRVLTTFSCSSFLGSKSSMQVTSWLSRCRRTSLLPVDCVASLERLSEWSRPMVLNIPLISSMLAQSVKCSKLKTAVFLKAFFKECWNSQQRSKILVVSVQSEQNEQNPGSRFWVFQSWNAWLGNCSTCLQVFFVYKKTMHNLIVKCIKIRPIKNLRNQHACERVNSFLLQAVEHSAALSSGRMATQWFFSSNLPMVCTV